MKTELGRIDIKTEVWALGSTVWEMLSGGFSPWFVIGNDKTPATIGALAFVSHPFIYVPVSVFRLMKAPSLINVL